jgi:trehalose utilization protein
MSIRVTVWGENVHEQKNKVVAEVYPRPCTARLLAR